MGSAGPPVVVGIERPSNPVLGTLFYSTSTRVLEFFDGTAWREMQFAPPR